MTGSNWCTHDILPTDEILLHKSILDTSSPSDDVWKKFLTPPSSPQSIGESSESEETTDSFDTCARLQYVCDNLDIGLELTTRCTNSFNLGLKLISDCMWSGVLPDLSKIQSKEKFMCTRKLTLDAEDLYPSPCPSPLSNMNSSTSVPDCPSTSECVDPTAVFPLTSNNEFLFCPTDTDEEIDVVTIDSKPINIVGLKRQSSTSIVYTKIQTTSVLKRTRSSPAKLRSDRLMRKSALIDDLDPTSRRASHNVLERKRRIDLKRSFEKLRECVPNLEREEKAPKVVVLKKALMYILALKTEEKELTEQKRTLQKENEELNSKLKKILFK
ncbi:myc proto-oncogene protein 2 isoform X1 [Hydra vulgaris]|uniref:Myc proto-oncogene protein n=1 Tax=Hydra vulgaris TaxID=6087 RepID=T2MH01_HYDVU|nr:myc proto-oncogene protein 2 isoform X1 [Hydra vulgaris]XP_047140438.1 myc proto-oncogene protein 2 isoform X1 [Hydra vulgaris]